MPLPAVDNHQSDIHSTQLVILSCLLIMHISFSVNCLIIFFLIFLVNYPFYFSIYRRYFSMKSVNYVACIMCVFPDIWFFSNFRISLIIQKLIF